MSNEELKTIEEIKQLANIIDVSAVTGFKHCCLIGKTVRYNDFCSYGERKEGAN